LLNYKLGEGHIGSSFSIVDVLHGLYSLNDIGQKDDSSIFILSKGHASFALYATLIEHKHIPSKVMDDYQYLSTYFGGHPDRNKLSEIIASTGSLGHGLPIAVGIALADIANSRERKIFVLVGDGELNEGTCWESLMLIENHNLRQITIIVDRNHSNDSSINLLDLKSKLESFSFSVFEFDGHSALEIESVFNGDKSLSPTALIANTIKGYGIAKMENSREWHHKSINSDELFEFQRELAARYA
jgi:transketolase